MTQSMVSVTVDQVREVLEAVLPEAEERHQVVCQLAESIEHARGVAPLAWSVSLFSDGFRLNVGQVEVLVLTSYGILVNLLEGRSLNDLRQRMVSTKALVHERPYRSVHAAHCGFFATASEFVAVRDALRQAHLEFIDAAGRNKAGTPRKGTPFRRAHCEALVRFAEAEHVLRMATDAAGLEMFDERYVEGHPVLVRSIRYERSPEAREACLKHYGPTCMICGFDFDAVYGAFAKGCIHVHHLEPLSQIASAYSINPVTDLRPVCPNCHAVIHRRMPPYSIDEVKAMLRETRGTN